MAYVIEDAVQVDALGLGQKLATMVVRHMPDWKTADDDATAGLEKAMAMVTSGTVDAVDVYVFGCMCRCGLDRTGVVCICYKSWRFLTPQAFIAAWDEVQDLAAAAADRDVALAQAQALADAA